MPQTLLTLPVKPIIANALPMVVQANSTPVASTSGPTGQFSQLQGKVDASNRLFVKIV